VLDFGAGTGALVQELRERGISAEGVEYSADARAWCLRERGIELHRDTSAAGQGQYQLVTMLETIEHVTDLAVTLREMRSALRPRGRLLVTTPNYRGLRARLDGGHWREARKPYHLFLFDWSSLAFHLSAAGFEDIERVRFSPIQHPGRRAQLKGRLLQGLGLAGTLCVVARSPGGAT
jgi:2-polyprenyl-3-methyl-5-hydroxy-6-metoxy-1,4-benzoquinol methylase